MVKGLKVGDKTPPFLLKDHEDYNVTNDDIIGTTVVLYFYPKDDTPGCTEQACSFRDQTENFDKRQTLVIGVSPDSVESHNKFIKKNKLEFSLLSDEKKELSRIFGALDEKNNIIRSTFIINSQGEICWMEKPVNVKGHAERVIKALDEHCKKDIMAFDDVEASYTEFLHANLKMNQDQKKIEDDILKKFGIKKTPPESKSDE